MAFHGLNSSKEQKYKLSISICLSETCTVKSAELINSGGFKPITINKHFITCALGLPKHPDPPCCNGFFHIPSQGWLQETGHIHRLTLPKITTKNAEFWRMSLQSNLCSSVSGKDKSLLIPGVIPLMWSERFCQSTKLIWQLKKTRSLSYHHSAFTYISQDRIWQFGVFKQIFHSKRIHIVTHKNNWTSVTAVTL